jgi:hypothetical protein
MWTAGLNLNDQSQGRMTGHQMASAFPAVLPLARCGLLERANVFGARCDPHGVMLPKGEGIERGTRPRTALPKPIVASNTTPAGIFRIALFGLPLPGVYSCVPT